MDLLSFFSNSFPTPFLNNETSPITLMQAMAYNIKASHGFLHDVGITFLVIFFIHELQAALNKLSWQARAANNFPDGSGQTYFPSDISHFWPDKH